MLPAGAAPAFEIRGLSKVYSTEAGEVHALRGVDLEIRAGETLVLLGPSGSGKSTLLNILGGLDRASAGKARFRGFELTGASDGALTRYRRESVGFIFQFFNLVPSLTARENVALITEIARDPMTPEEALARVGLSERMDHFPAQLSGGEQQRVAVARAIAKRPPRSTRMRSMKRVSSRLWVATTAATPRVRARSCRLRNTDSEVAGSRLPVGSSQSSRRG